MPRKQVVYVAHPVGVVPSIVECNLKNVVKWLRYFVVADPSRVYTVPWVAEVLAFPGGGFVRSFDDALSDDEEILSRLDQIILVGGDISPGMQRELNKARALGMRVTDMSEYRSPSDLPPGFSVDSHGV